MDDGFRRRRARLWASVYAAVFDPADGHESDADDGSRCDRDDDSAGDGARPGAADRR